MIHDHSMAEQQLEQIASTEGHAVPSTVSASDHAQMLRLQRNHGSRFNAAYSTAQERDHREVIAIFRQAEQDPRIAPALRRYARMTLPTLMEHLHMANQLMASGAGENRSAG